MRSKKVFKLALVTKTFKSCTTPNVRVIRLVMMNPKHEEHLRTMFPPHGRHVLTFVRLHFTPTGVYINGHSTGSQSALEENDIRNDKLSSAIDFIPTSTSEV